MLANAWRDVKPFTIANCFNKAFSLPKDSDNIVYDDILADVSVHEQGKSLKSWSIRVF